jgi:zinc D-Ala-D-Ala carboxypeptidase
VRSTSGAWIAALAAAFLLLRGQGARADPWGLVGPGEGLPGDDETEENPEIGFEGVDVSTVGSARLSEHFTVAEFTASRTALARGIDNDLPIELLANARATAAMLERIRSHLSDLKGRTVPIIVTSGYRSQALNSAIGGSPRSDHLQALAADIRAPSFGTPLEVARALEGVTDEMGIGQLINEYPDRGGAGWVHVSIQSPAQAINRIITVTAAGTVPGIVAA